jgi:quinol-cytochrome oxidoreductase complex cytochrome b subunit
VFVLPALLSLLFVYHVWRIRRDGGLARSDRDLALEQKVEQPKAATKTYTLLGIARGTAPTVRAVSVEAPDRTVNSVPDLTRRAAIVVLLTIAVVSILSALIRSPLEEAANPLITPNPAKAPWYFLWLQEIVTDTTFRIGSFTVNGAFLGGVVLPGLLIVALTLWPWLDKSPGATAGTWFPRSRRAQNLVFLGIVLLILIFTLIGVFFRGPYWQFYWPWEAWPSIPTRI